MTDTDDGRPGRRRLTVVHKGRLTAGFLGAAALLLIWTLARARVLPPRTVIWVWLGQWWPAVVSAGLAVAVLVLHRRPRSTSADPGHDEGRWTRLTTLVTAFTAVAALLFTALSLGATRDQIGITEQGQFTDRYTKAIDQLGTPGAEHLWVRVGGIFALERVATDSPRDQRAIVEVLGAFIRTAAHRPDPTTTCPTTPADIEAAFLVLTRRQVAREKHDPLVIDLRDTCLAGIRATGADLSGISLVGSDLHDADLPLVHGDLVGLSKVTLTHANLYEADLSGYAAGFTDADLTGARLSYATIGPNELTKVKLVNADLTGADLRGATFTGVDLTGAR
ncbi:MAG TPA: pentapeptide repeat-containing protein, partial [Pseudonocardiaceae bacterium]